MIDQESTDVPRRAPPPGTEEFDQFIADQSATAVDVTARIVLVRIAAAFFLLCFLATFFATVADNPINILIWVMCIPWVTELGSVAFRGKSIYCRTMLGKQKNRKHAKPDEPPAS